jgi:hypothetical protein
MRDVTVSAQIKGSGQPDKPGTFNPIGVTQPARLRPDNHRGTFRIRRGNTGNNHGRSRSNAITASPVKMGSASSTSANQEMASASAMTSCRTCRYKKSSHAFALA